jgi:hypothetical protein
MAATGVIIGVVSVPALPKVPDGQWYILSALRPE